jgi:hypothetical protein
VTGARKLFPLVGALPLTGVIAGASLALQTSLNAPPAGSGVAAAAVASLERLSTVTTLETLPGGTVVRATCSYRHHVDHLRVGDRFTTEIRGGRLLDFSGGRPTPADIVEAELAVCPGFAVDELSHRLRLGLPTLRRRVVLGGHERAYIVRIHGPAPFVDLTLARPTLGLLRADVVSRSGRAAAAVVNTTVRANPSLRPVKPAKFLRVAEKTLGRTHRVFWNPRLGWYDERVAKAYHPRKPLAHLWSAFPLFEALDAVALADPTAANRNAVAAFARGAERYYDPNLSPVGGYTWYPGITNPRQHAFFDDDGWWELSYLDAYRATGDPRDLVGAERAFRFIEEAGWDPRWGGTWWETLHKHKTSEPLAAEIYTGLGLYLITNDRSYLETALKWLSWANLHSWNAEAKLYDRSPTDTTVLDYVEGMMIGAQLELCEIRGVTGPCTAAEKLAKASLAAFPPEANWTPAADAVYLRFLLALYEQDGNRTWYDVVYSNARRALALARSSDHLFFKRWDGTPFPARELQPDAATLSLFAWLGGVHSGTA